MLGIIEITFVNETAASMHSLLGANTSIKALRLPSSSNAVRNDGIFANLMSNNAGDAHFITPPRYATNGLYYIIDTLLIPPNFPLVSYLFFSCFVKCLLSIARKLPNCHNKPDKVL